MATFSLKELRRAYSRMPILEFVKIYETWKESDDLLDALDQAEARAVEGDRQAKLAFGELEKRLSASEQHHLLHFIVGADIDLEHSQAVLMHGFLMPGKDHAFIGSKVLPESHVRKNVSHKLGFRFSTTKYNAALDYLKRQGVLNQPSSGHDESLSLKSAADGETSGHGTQILRVALEFARKKRLAQ